MRCVTARKRLSDDLDGALPTRKKCQLETHMRECPRCQAYSAGLFRLQAGAGAGEERSPEYWDGFEKRLASKLAALEPDGTKIGAPFSGRGRWASAAAGLLVLAAAGTYFSVIRPGRTVETAWVPFEDSLAPLLQEAEANPELGNLVNREILASIEELIPAPEIGPAAPPADDPLFWEGLSEGELRYIVSELERETGRGGPK
jgi:hypothetical protein